jgi:hypothetical protein
MSNMSYCRFTNTRADLEDCCEALEEIPTLLALSDAELSAADQMYELCRRYVARYEELTP